MTVLQVVMRRWYVVVPVLAITVAAIFGVSRTSKPVYDVSASVILLVPNTDAPPGAGGDAGRNPYLDLSGSLVTTARAVADVLNGPATRRNLAAEGSRAVYEVEATDRIPTLSIRASGTDPEVALATVRAVMQRAGEELNRLQDAVQAPADERISPAVLVEPSVPSGTRAHVTRALAAIGALGVLAALSLALITENIAGSPSRRHRDAGEADEGSRAVSGDQKSRDDEPRRWPAPGTKDGRKPGTRRRGRDRDDDEPGVRSRLTLRPRP